MGSGAGCWPLPHPPPTLCREGSEWALWASRAPGTGGFVLCRPWACFATGGLSNRVWHCPWFLLGFSVSWQGMGLARGYGGSGGSPSHGHTPGSSLTCLWSRSHPPSGSSPDVVLCQTCFCGVELKSFILSGLIWKVNMLTSRQLSSGIWDFVPAPPPSEAARGSALGVLFPGNGIAQSDESSACGVGSLTHGV